MIVAVGLAQNEIQFPIVNACVREVDIRGVFRYANWSVNCSVYYWHGWALETSWETLLCLVHLSCKVRL